MLYTIPLKLAIKFEKLAAMRGVSAVARGEAQSSQTQGGFFQAAKRAGGNIHKLSKMPVKSGSHQMWWQRRNAFCERHSIQQSLNQEPLIETSGKYKGTPTRRQLGLLMWMGSNISPQTLRSILPKVKLVTK